MTTVGMGHFHVLLVAVCAFGGSIPRDALFFCDILYSFKVLYLVPMVIECRLMLAIRCYDQFVSSGRRAPHR